MFRGNFYFLPPLYFGRKHFCFYARGVSITGRSLGTESGFQAASTALCGKAPVLAVGVSPPDIPLQGQKSPVISRETEEVVCWWGCCIPLGFHNAHEHTKALEKPCGGKAYSIFPRCGG